MKRVIVTGSSRGIGRAVALRLARDGFAVTAHAVRNAAAARQTAAECARISGQPEQPALVFDLADRAAVTAALEADMAERGPFFGVVANAGVNVDAPFPVLEGDAWDKVISTDLTGLYNLLKPLVMPMITNRIRGRIVAMSSVSGIAGNRGQVNYSASKAGLIGLTKSVAKELAPRGICCNAIAPGFVETDMTAQEGENPLIQQIPLGRLGKPEDIAELAAFLAAPASDYITGQVIHIDGGLAM